MAHGELAVGDRVRRRRTASGIYGAIITASILAATGDVLRTRAVAVAVVFTLAVYWLAEEYAELLAEPAGGGKLPDWPHIRKALATSWPMVTASFVPLLVLVVARVLGASPGTAADFALVTTIGLLMVHARSAGRAADLRGRQLIAMTCAAGGIGLAMIALKHLVLVHLH